VSEVVAVQPPQERGPSYRDVQIAQVGGGGMLLPQTFGDAVAFSTLMARSQHAIPRHLRDNPGACLAVTMQALRWGMDPFLVAAKSYSVNDMVAYESQLVNAVVNTRAPIRGRLKIAFEGASDDRVCLVTGTFEDGTEQVYESPPRKLISPKNSPLWKTDPDQQHAYNSTRAWARRFCPEVLLGVYADDELADHRGPDRARDVTPRPALADRLTSGKSQGFSADAVNQQTSTGPAVASADHDPETGEIADPAPALPQPSPEPAPSSIPARGAAAPSAPVEAPAAPAGSMSPSASTPLPMMADQEFVVHVARTLAATTTADSHKAVLAGFEPEIKTRLEPVKFVCRGIALAHRRRVTAEITDVQAAAEVEKLLERLAATETRS